MHINYPFYLIKPLIPRSFQISLRRIRAQQQLKKYSDIWPIDHRAKTPPPNWDGWPDKKKFALVLQHDVDTRRGHDRVRQLMDLEEDLGIRSTFFIVPERYRVSGDLLKEITDRGFGLGVHGLKHDGKLFLSYNVFKKNAAKVNTYLKAWKTRGFSSPSMHHQLDWMHHLDIDYSTSTFDTDPFEPQPDPVCTIFPFAVKNISTNHSFIELPYTLVQDFTLFIILNKKNIDPWKQKLAWIVESNGMALLNTHPDYMYFSNKGNPGPEEYPVAYYAEFIKHAKSVYEHDYWNPLHSELTEYIRTKEGVSP